MSWVDLLLKDETNYFYGKICFKLSVPNISYLYIDVEVLSRNMGLLLMNGFAIDK